MESDKPTLAPKALGDFERVFQTRLGPIALLGTASTQGVTLTLGDIAVYPIGPPSRFDVGITGVRAGLADLKDEIAGMGYDRLVINGTRVSGAVPGKLVQTVINLSRGDSDEKRA